MLKILKGFLVTGNTLLQWLLAYMSSASGGRALTPTRALPLDPLGDFGFVPLRNKFLATPLAGEVKGNERRGKAGRNRTEQRERWRKEEKKGERGQ